MGDTLHAYAAPGGRYQVLRKLGVGGTGVVYEARLHDGSELVALKELAHQSPLSLAGFKQEFRALQDVSHPNLVQLHELIEHEGCWLIAMELVPGCDLLTWVRPPKLGGGFDEGRLRSALRDMADGLHALHGAGLLHRDLKPSNVRVTPEGRAVLLDFGLVTTIERRTDHSNVAGVGTAAYMAPEQAAGDKMDEASDWYAFGVCMYEALSGLLPVDGTTALQVIMAKQTARPLPPSQRGKHVPTDLEMLCMQLLLSDPRARPSGEEVLAQLARGSSPPAPTTQLSLRSAAFSGRASELARLERARERTREGAQAIVLIEGRSGVGKTALVDELVRRSQQRDASTVVLRGRCYERETVPYKAFDGVVDAIAHHLRRLPRSACEAVLPRRAALLHKLFPVLGIVPSIANAPERGVPADPSAQRILAFEALRELLGRLADGRALIVAVDDLQWADAASFELLDALSAPKERPPVLFVLTCRSDDQLDAALRLPIERVRGLAASERIELGGLRPSDAAQLARELLAAHRPAQWVERIVAEGEGHPLLIAELARYVEHHDSTDTLGELTLESVVARRVAALDAEARTLLEVIALAVTPQTSRTIARALARKLRDPERAIAYLRHAKLVRAVHVGRVVCFHDRVRETVTALIEPSQARALHAELARALSTEAQVDPADVAAHWEAADELERARDGYERAADRALCTFAFGQAAELYARCLTLASHSLVPHRRRWLCIQRGHALARAGQSAEAATLYLAAVEGAPHQEQHRLRTLAAQHLLQGAQIEAGLAAARTLLLELGVVLPEATGHKLAHLLWDRACLAASRFRVAAPDRSEISDSARAQLDVLWALSTPLGWVDLLSGAMLNSRHLRLALASGERAHAAQALAQEGLVLAAQKPQRRERYERLFQRSRSLSEGDADPVLGLMQDYLEGTAALFTFRLDAAQGLLERAEAACERCPDEPWRLANVRMSLGCVLWHRGEHARLASVTEGWLAQAHARKDRFALSALSGLGSGALCRLLEDRPDLAVDELESVMAPWPREPFGLAHFGELFVTGWSRSYRADGGLGRWLDAHRHEHRRAFLLKTLLAGVWLDTFATASALEASLEANTPETRERVRKRATRLARHDTPFAQASAQLALAQLDALASRPERALERARHAARAFGEMGHFLQHGASHLVGVLEGGETGRARIEAANACFSTQGWKSPERALRMCTPAIDALMHAGA